MKPTNPGVPVWSHDGISCTGETYKSAVKLTFAKGASPKDPAPSFQFESRLQRPPRDRHSCRQPCWQVESFEESPQNVGSGFSRTTDAGVED